MMKTAANRIDSDGEARPAMGGSRTASRELDPFKLWLRQGLRASGPGLADMDPLAPLPAAWISLVDRLPPTD